MLIFPSLSSYNVYIFHFLQFDYFTRCGIEWIMFHFGSDTMLCETFSNSFFFSRACTCALHKGYILNFLQFCHLNGFVAKQLHCSRFSKEFVLCAGIHVCNALEFIEMHFSVKIEWRLAAANKTQATQFFVRVRNEQQMRGFAESQHNE